MHFTHLHGVLSLLAFQIYYLLLINNYEIFTNPIYKKLMVYF